jgi:hypothetical protein
LPKIDAFRKLVVEASKRLPSAAQQKFVKKLECIPSVELPLEETCRSAVNLADRGLIGQFTGLWPSPKSVEAWVQRNWSPLISEGIKSHFIGKGYLCSSLKTLKTKTSFSETAHISWDPRGYI